MTTSINDPITMAVAETDVIPPEPNIPEKRNSKRPSAVAFVRGSIVEISRPILKFYDIFGIAGYGMLIVFLLSTIWTLILTAIQVEPVKMANSIMNTTNYDQGEFWLLPIHDKSIQVLSIIVLLLLSLGYLCLAALMIFPNHLHPVKQVSKVSTKAGEVDLVAIKLQDVPKKKFSLARLHHELFYPNGLLHHSFAALLDGPKLVFQTMTLFLYLNSGFPIVIIYVYSCLLFINWVMSAYRYHSRRPDPHLVLARVFYSFDLFFAVFAPLEVLIYSYYHFDFDRVEFQTRLDALPPGAFDNIARLFADPEKINVFRIAFNYLNFSSIGGILIKAALNILSLYKWKKTIVHLIDLSRQRNEIHANEIKASPTHERRSHIQKSLIALVFLFAGMGLFIYSIVAVETTRDVCKSHPQCIVRAYQWNVGSKYCSCLVFVDRETSPRTYYEWENPPDKTKELAALAMTGHLRIIQIINRDIGEFPIELRNCKNLEQVILMYTKTLRFPEWMGEFSHLEYLHIEGDFTDRRITYMPQNMFKNMPKLTFVHFGVLVDLPAIPDLTHLHQLRYVTFAALHGVHTPPDFTGLTNLRSILMVECYNFVTLPSITTQTNLQSLIVYLRHPVCCNGYLNQGVCNLNDWACVPRAGEPSVQCSSDQWPEENWNRLKKVPNVHICEEDVLFDVKDTAPTKYTTDDLCGGVKYKQCSIGGMPGMCFNPRMMVIQCDVTGQFEALRRLQIKRKVGPPCDPAIEAWLGCQ